jgi:hypothetical protein
MVLLECYFLALLHTLVGLVCTLACCGAIHAVRLLTRPDQRRSR